MKTIADPPERDRWARLRFSIIGPLMAAPPDPGQLNDALNALAAKTWRHPVTGLDVGFGASTLERWYYAARAHFSDRGRLFQSDRGQCFSAIVDALGMRASEVVNVAQSSTISLKR